jgi:hypothetical protein
MSDDEAQQIAKFQKTVEDLRTWLNQRCATPAQAVSVMGSVASELIWQNAESNQAAEQEVLDFCSRMALHVRTLNTTTVEVTLQ